MVSYFGKYGKVDRNNPEAAGICDRGGEVRKYRELHKEMEWRGGRLVWNGFLVCRHHLDKPNPQISGPNMLHEDPVPIRNPRPVIDFSDMPPSGGNSAVTQFVVF